MPRPVGADANQFPGDFPALCGDYPRPIAFSNFRTGFYGQTFEQTYGTNADRSNAFGTCVSSKAKAASTAQAEATVRAALACKAQQRSNAATFKAKYKTFGRCVKLLAAASSQ